MENQRRLRAPGRRSAPCTSADDLWREKEVATEQLARTAKRKRSILGKIGPEAELEDGVRVDEVAEPGTPHSD